MERIAVVMGGGGITGIAWLLGAVAAIREHTGWDPADAEIICGTSAGAVAAVVTAARLSPEPLLRMAEDRATLDRSIARATGSRPPVRNRIPLAWPGSMALGLTGLAAVDPGQRLRSLAGFAPAGFRSGDEIRGLVHEAAEAGWRARPRLLINATDYGTGRRVTFGLEGAPAAPLLEAVTASAAVPGWYQAVTIGGRRYVDGGMVSFSNADVVGRFDPDLVICLSPFGTRNTGGARDTALLGPLRHAIARQRDREVAGLRAGGARVLVLEPSRADIDAMGINPMERRHVRAVLAQARESATQQLASAWPGIAERPRLLAAAGPRAAETRRAA